MCSRAKPVIWQAEHASQIGHLCMVWIAVWNYSHFNIHGEILPLL
ncbi:hypothetical protein ALP50_200067 [Pseudomonas syringae pv. spinaceae]|nr:hypothetical protein ALP50_200067 [Pseudomonas syringae pv. spinaceae]